MANIEVKRNKDGEITGYRFRCCVGRDEHRKQVWRTVSIERPVGLTPKKEERLVSRLADEWEQEQREEYEKNKHRIVESTASVKSRITLEEFIDKNWMEKHVKDGKHTPDTIAFYESMSADIKAYFKRTNPGIKLNQVGKEEVLDYLVYMRTETRTKRGKPYSPTTIQHHFSTLRNIMSYAVYLDYIKEDPCKKLKTSDRPKRVSHEIDYLDEDEAIKFISCLESEEEINYWAKNKNSYLYWKCLINALMLTGLRRGELVGLQWRDVDEKKLMLRIRRNVTIDNSNKGEKDASKKIHVGETKGKDFRSVPITRHLMDLLLEYREEQSEKFKGKLTASDYIFCRSDNKSLPIYPTEPTRQLKKFVERHGIKDVSPHDLRHTAATLAMDSGASIKEIQKLLGHKDASTTLKFYTGIAEKTQRKTVEGIEGKLRPKEEEKK